MSRAALQQYTLQGVRETGVELGRGSYAAVYAVEYNDLKYAAKNFYPTLYQQHYSVRRFQEECKILSQLKHPNIVKFVGVYYKQDSMLPALVMECLPMTLAQYLDQYGVPPNERGYSILKDVALALSYLHQHDPQIIHRDLSANNVLLTRGLTAKISDLGGAKMLEISPQMRTMTEGPGTLCYMPLEALEPKPHYNRKIDIFSYGVLMVHLFSGQWPFPTRAVMIDPQDPSRVIPQTEADRRQKYLNAIGSDHPLMNLILRCIHNNPDLRPEAVVILGTVSQLAAQFPEIEELLQPTADTQRRQQECEIEVRADIVWLQQEREETVRVQQEHEIEMKLLKADTVGLRETHEVEITQTSLSAQLQETEISSEDSISHDLQEQLESQAHIEGEGTKISVNLELEMQMEAWNKLSQERPLRLLVCGLGGIGKSTLVNHLLQLGDEKWAEEGMHGRATTSVVSKYERTTEQGIKVCIFDSPGFSDSKLSDAKIVAMMKKDTEGKLDLVLYCLSLGCSPRVQRADIGALKILTEAFTSEIWNKTVIVLTFANKLAEQTADADEYKTVVEAMKSNLRDEFRMINISQLPIVTAGHTNPILKYEEDKSPQAWDDRLFLEALRKVDPAKLPSLLQCRLNWKNVKCAVVWGGSTAAVSGLAGATIGTGLGAIVGPVGMGVGAGIGFAAGAFLGAVSGATTGLRYEDVSSILKERLQSVTALKKLMEKTE